MARTSVCASLFQHLLGNPLTVLAQDPLRPYPTVGNISVAGYTNSSSSYSAGTIELERRFARPAYGKKGNAARTLDWGRYPWKQNLNASLLKNFYPFENHGRVVQLRAEFYNVLNHVVFTPQPSSASNLFAGVVPVSRTGTSLAGPIPYYPAVKSGTFPVGSREQVLGQYYNANFGRLLQAGNGPGRVISLALRLSW